MQDLLRSEALCLDYARRAVDWLNGFYVPDSHTFHVAYSSQDHQSINNKPNAATSIIGIVIEELALYWDISLRLSREQLEQRVAESRQSIIKNSLEDILPLRSFGYLPLFSTCYLARFFAAARAPLTIDAYAVALRRVLFAMYQQTSPTSATRQTDRLHPFLLYSCAKSISLFRDVVTSTGVSGHTADINAFIEKLCNDDLIVDLVPPANLDSIYGRGATAANFKENYVATLITPSGAGPGIEKLLQTAEDIAIHHVMTEIAARSRSADSRCDPSSLVFSLAILADINVTRHAALIGQGSRVVVSSIQDGIFPTTLPFHIDTQGRALFVPSIEIANALLSITLKRGDAVPTEELHEILNGTRAVEARLVEDEVRVDIIVGDGVRRPQVGWCSDRAPSVSRVDSWITVHALAFFLRRLFLIRSAKRTDVLTRYSWVPSEKCRPSWEEIADPDAGLEPRGVKDQILEVVDADIAKRDRAPMFLLYGPPGTSKTTVVQGLARRKGWDLLTLSPSNFVEDSLDRIEQRARAIFNDLMSLDRCVVLMDEMDSLLRDRELLAERGTGNIIEFVVPALLPKLQQLRDYVLRRSMAVFFVSNYYEAIDHAIIRAGRIDNHILILPYCRNAQREVLERLLEGRGRKDLLDPLLNELSRLPCRFGYRDLEQFVTVACSEPEPPDLASAIPTGPTYGIQPEVYRAPQRLEAFREVCAFIERLQNRSYARTMLFSRAAACSALSDAQRAIPEWPEWKEFLVAWADKLRNPAITHRKSPSVHHSRPRKSSPKR